MTRRTEKTLWLLAALAVTLPAAAEAQVYVGGSANVQVQGSVQAGHAPAHGHAPAAAPAPATTAGTMQARGGFIGGDLMFHGWVGEGAAVGGAGLLLRSGWELASGMLPYVEVGINVTAGGGAAVAWYNLAGGFRWALYNQTAFAPFLGGRIDVARVENWDGEAVATLLGIGPEGGFLLELSKFMAITATVRYTIYLGGASRFGVGGGLLVFY